MKSPLIAQLEARHMRDDVPDFGPGDTIRVHVKITETTRNEVRTRIQPFEGVVIARSGGGVNEMVTVRRVTYGVGVERTFPVHAPIVDHIEVVRRGHVRRARLHYLRGRSGRASRIPQAKSDKPRQATRQEAPAVAEEPIAAAPIEAEATDQSAEQAAVVDEQAGASSEETPRDE